MKKSILAFSIIGLVALAMLVWRGCYSDVKLPGQSSPTVSLVLDWYDFALRADRHCEGYRSPVAARVYAYVGIAAWEAALPALGNEWSEPQLLHREGLVLPKPLPNAEYDLPSLLNACYSTIFQKMFLLAPIHVEKDRKALDQKWATANLAQVDSATYHRSVEFGKKVALAVYDWSATDTVSHMAYLHNFDKGFETPSQEGFWQPCEDFPSPPILPHWGSARCFAIENTDHMAAPLPPYSMAPQSVYYVQALEVYTINSPLSAENQWIAEFWNDDIPGLTFSSAGRWVSITNQVVRQEQPPLEKALETYLRLGIALNDAAVSCWHSKYHYNLLRPETLIRQTIQGDWRPIVHTPSFPAYPSGHAMLGSAAAEVLTSLYGPNYELTDRSHEGRTEFKGKPRHFHSFYEMAFENAYSRIALGVHFRMDCDEGTRLGLNIGKVVAEVPVQMPSS